MPRFHDLLGDGKEIGLNLSYAVQPSPGGIAESFLIAEKFIGQDSVCLILGDNIFYGHGFPEILQETAMIKQGAVIFGYSVKDPERYGVVEFDKEFHVLSIEEKPKKPKSNWAVTGLYFYDNQVVQITKSLRPSIRGELEISDVNKKYLQQGRLRLKLLGRGYAWLDTGTYESLIDSAIFIKTIEERQGLKIGCVEEIAYRKGFITGKHLVKLAQSIHTSYGDYLRDITKR